MKKTNLLSLILVLAFSFITFSVVSAGWTAPPANPPLQNADAPINVSSAAQIKDGPLSIGNLFRAKTKILIGGANSAVPSKDLVLDVEGKAGAVEYCDNNGDNCVKSNQIGGGSNWTLDSNILSPKVPGNNVRVPRLYVQGGSWTTNGNDIFLNSGAPGQAFYFRPNGDGNTLNQMTLDSNGKAVATDFCLPSGVCLSQLTTGTRGGGTGGVGVSTLHAGPGISITDFDTGTAGAVSGNLLISATGSTGGGGGGLTCTNVEDYDEGTHPWLNWGDVYKESYISCPAGENIVSVVGDCANSSPADGGTIQVDSSTWKQRCVHSASQPNPFASSIRGQCCRN